MSSRYLFTSESVAAGHPDKVSDQISDAILDAIFAQDPEARVACETTVNTGLVLLSGEITTTAKVDYQTVVRETIRSIGYTDHTDQRHLHARGGRLGLRENSNEGLRRPGHKSTLWEKINARPS